MEGRSMKKISRILFGVTLLGTFVLTSGLLYAEETTPKRFIIYFTNWSGYQPVHQNFEARKIPWDKITHVNYAFYTVINSFKLDQTDPWADTQATYSGTKGHLANFEYYLGKHPKVKFLISVGGWTKGNNFHAMAATEKGRQTFVKSCVNYLKHNQWISGYDLDWEYPGIDRKPDPRDKNDLGCPGGPEDKQNYTLLLKTLREALDKNGMKDKLLSIAIPCGYDKIDLFDMKEIIKYLNYINVMTYDIHGALDKFTNHHSALYANPDDPTDTTPIDIKTTYNIDYAIKYLTGENGVPAGMLNLGIPYYGHGWKAVQADSGTNGLFALHDGSPYGLWDEPPLAGGNTPYFKLKEYETTPGWVKYRDDIAKVPWLYNSSTGEIWSYDDPESVAAKCDYIKANDLGGAMVWEIDGDDKQFTLTNTIYSKLLQTH
jgi:chitinase